MWVTRGVVSTAANENEAEKGEGESERGLGSANNSASLATDYTYTK